MILYLFSHGIVSVYVRQYALKKYKKIKLRNYRMKLAGETSKKYCVVIHIKSCLLDNEAKNYTIKFNFESNVYYSLCYSFWPFLGF